MKNKGSPSLFGAQGKIRFRNLRAPKKGGAVDPPQKCAPKKKILCAPGGGIPPFRERGNIPPGEVYFIKGEYPPPGFIKEF